MSEYGDLWPDDGSYFETSKGEIAIQLYTAGKITLHQMIDFIAMPPMDITVPFLAALRMKRAETDMYRHVEHVHLIKMPDNTIGVGTMVRPPLHINRFTAVEQEAWDMAMACTLQAVGFEVRVDDGMMQVRFPSDEDNGEWHSMSAEQQVETFVKELDDELGPSYDPTSRMSRWMKKKPK